MLGPLDAHRAVLPSQRPPSPPPHPHSHQPMPDYVHHDPVGPSPYEDASSNNNTGSNTRGDYLARVSGREPLQESTGNVQHHHPSHYPYGQRALPSLSAASSASCTPVLSHNLSAIPPPPILPTQTLGSTGVVVPSSSTASQQQQDQHQQHHHPGSGNGVIGGGSAALAAAAAAAAASGTSALRLRRHQLSLQRQSRHSKNPIYLSPEFCQYRVKQKDKDEQKWPDILEDAFLDGINFSSLSFPFRLPSHPAISLSRCISLSLSLSTPQHGSHNQAKPCQKQKEKKGKKEKSG